MSAHQHQQGIIVGVDGSPSSLEAVQWAARDAQMRNIALKIVHVVAPIVTGAAQGWSDVPGPSDYSKHQQEQAAKAIELAHSTAVAAAPSHADLISSEVLQSRRCQPWSNYPSTPKWSWWAAAVIVESRMFCSDQSAQGRSTMCTAQSPSSITTSRRRHLLRTPR